MMNPLEFFRLDDKFLKGLADLAKEKLYIRYGDPAIRDLLTQAQTRLIEAQTQAIPTEIEERMARAGLTRAQATAIPSTIEETLARSGLLKAQTESISSLLHDTSLGSFFKNYFAPIEKFFSQSLGFLQEQPIPQIQPLPQPSGISRLLERNLPSLWYNVYGSALPTFPWIGGFR